MLLGNATCLHARKLSHKFLAERDLFGEVCCGSELQESLGSGLQNNNVTFWLELLPATWM